MLGKKILLVVRKASRTFLDVTCPFMNHVPSGTMSLSLFVHFGVHSKQNVCLDLAVQDMTFPNRSHFEETGVHTLILLAIQGTVYVNIIEQLVSRSCSKECCLKDNHSFSNTPENHTKTEDFKQ